MNPKIFWKGSDRLRIESSWTFTQQAQQLQLRHGQPKARTVNQGWLYAHSCVSCCAQKQSSLRALTLRERFKKCLRPSMNFRQGNLRTAVISGQETLPGHCGTGHSSPETQPHWFLSLEEQWGSCRLKVYKSKLDLQPQAAALWVWDDLNSSTLPKGGNLPLPFLLPATCLVQCSVSLLVWH